MARASDPPADAERRRTPRKRVAKATMRMGMGYDSHRFGPGNAVRLGGVSIPHDHALTGHSDADAIAHAVTDALLGAAGEGDIGSMFPDSDPANRMRDSIEMLTLAIAHLREPRLARQQRGRDGDRGAAAHRAVSRGDARRARGRARIWRVRR